jgi:hypothetical protein
VADFSRTTCEHLDEHLLALISGRTQQRDKDYKQNQIFAAVNDWRLYLEKQRLSSGEALDIFLLGEGRDRSDAAGQVRAGEMATRPKPPRPQPGPTPLGFYNFAVSYHEGGDLIADRGLKATHPESVAMFLYYHAIELYLKSFLRLQGVTAKRLRKIGHDFSDFAIARKEARPPVWKSRGRGLGCARRGDLEPRALPYKRSSPRPLAHNALQNEHRSETIGRQGIPRCWRTDPNAVASNAQALRSWPTPGSDRVGEANGGRRLASREERGRAERQRGGRVKSGGSKYRAWGRHRLD